MIIFAFITSTILVVMLSLFIANIIMVLIELENENYESKKDFWLTLLIPFRRWFSIFLKEYRDMGK